MQGWDWGVYDVEGDMRRGEQGCRTGPAPSERQAERLGMIQLSARRHPPPTSPTTPNVTISAPHPALDLETCVPDAEALASLPRAGSIPFDTPTASLCKDEGWTKSTRTWPTRGGVEEDEEEEGRKREGRGKGEEGGRGRKGEGGGRGKGDMWKEDDGDVGGGKKAWKMREGRTRMRRGLERGRMPIREKNAMGEGTKMSREGIDRRPAGCGEDADEGRRKEDVTGRVLTSGGGRGREGGRQDRDG
ncbi:hypothetical protein FA13DRAFT_1712418 [Coprinellus micaceus]|uniref:Uncharacterized protein n=1 Tax=Coprinellus micaceus TaxID=71717 RepID=A0A4Y7T122_COPMI|nr:hypothetical protein FA13DRAFT_1712418 [Coprinellus micaceus]